MQTVAEQSADEIQLGVASEPRDLHYCGTESHLYYRVISIYIELEALMEEIS